MHGGPTHGSLQLCSNNRSFDFLGSHNQDRRKEARWDERHNAERYAKDGQQTRGNTEESEEEEEEEEAEEKEEEGVCSTSQRQRRALRSVISNPLFKK